MTTLTEIILEKVQNGIKATELCAEIPSELHKHKIQLYNSDEILREIERLIKTGEIVEMEYVLPHINYRIKSFLLPKGTIINLPVTLNHSLLLTSSLAGHE